MTSSVYDGLERLFHEPARLAILTELAGSQSAVTFVTLKERCGLTDGNLNRHLRHLEEGKIVKLTKRFVDSKPQTTVVLTARGRDSFIEYLSALEKVLAVAVDRAGHIEPIRSGRKGAHHKLATVKG